MNKFRVIDLSLRSTFARLLELPGGTLVATLAFIIPFTILYALYNAYLHPLRQYPGPLFWRCFRFPYVISTQRGELHTRLKEFHTKYGAIVRIAPNELSYTDSAAWKEIYNRPGQQPFSRNRTWFRKMTPDEPNSILGYDEEDHTRFRRIFANSFSDKSLRDQAPVVESYLSTFISQLSVPINGRQWTSKTIDLEKWFNYLMFDISGDLSFGESFDCLRTGKAHSWVETVQDFGKGLALVASINQYPPVEKLLQFIIPKKVLQKMKDHREISAAKAQQRLALHTERPDFVTPARKYIAQKGVTMTDKEWTINMLIIAFAASETTASALTGIMRELLQHKGVLHRLTTEIREHFVNEADISVATTGTLPYLNAVIDEGLRLDPPVVIGVPRVCPPGGVMVCHRWVPAGTYVTFNQFAANRQAYNFRHPNSFIPERFLKGGAKGDRMACFQPFSVGTHSCLGMKLAYAEMRVILARLLWRFDVRLEKEEDRWDWGEQKTYIFWDKKPLKVVLRRAETII